MSLQDAIQRETGIPVKVRAGAPGSLNIFVDGEKVFSYNDTHRFPTSAEVIQLIRDRTPQTRSL